MKSAPGGIPPAALAAFENLPPGAREAYLKLFEDKTFSKVGRDLIEDESALVRDLLEQDNAERAEKQSASVAAQVEAARSGEPLAPGGVREPARPGTVSGATAATPGRIPGAAHLSTRPTSYPTPFASERGEQKLEDLRIAPLQNKDGQYLADRGQAEKRLAQLKLTKLATQAGYQRLADIPHEEFLQMAEQAQEEAKREVQGIIGSGEGRGNFIVPVDPEERIREIKRGVIPLPAALLVGGAPLASTLVSKWNGEGLSEDGWAGTALKLWAPFAALASPGSGAFDTQTGERVQDARREGGFWWFLRLAPSTIVGSWLLDPEMTWEIGGEKGWGGDRHVRKIVGGYDVLSDLHRLGELWDGVTPWESSTAEKLVAAGVPLAATILLEPDALSIGTGLLAAPISKGIKAFKTGSLLIEKLYEPTLKSWDEAMEGGAKVADIAKEAGPEGNPKRDAFRVIYAETLARIARKSGGDDGRVGAVADLDKVGARNVEDIKQKAAQEAADAIVARKGAEGDVAAAETKLGETQAEVRAKLGEQRTETEKLVEATDEARRQYEAAEEAVLASVILRERGGPTRVGDRVLTPDGMAGKVRNSRVVSGVEVHEVVYDSGRVVEFPRDRLRRVPEPGSDDARRVLAELFRLKTARERAKAKIKAAKSAGDAQALDAAKDELRRINSLVIENVGDIRLTTTEAAYIAARRKMMQAKAALAAANARALEEAKRLGKKLTPKYKQLQKAQAALEKATSEEAVKLRQARAAQLVEDEFRQVVREYRQSFGELRQRIARGTQDQVVPGDATSRGRFLLATLEQAKTPPGFSAESWMVWGYQVANRLARQSDLVGSSIIGRMPKVVREIVRRSHERFANGERELARVWKADPQGVTDYLTSDRAFDGVYGNRDTLSLADKAVAYLRNLSDDAWKEDVVVRAISNAPLPSWRSASLSPAAVGGALRSMVQDPTFDGVALWKWLEETAPSIYLAVLGKTDTPEVMRRFLARAIVQAANQHDAINDLVRLTGPRLGKDASDALNWFTKTEGAVKAYNVDEALRAAHAFNLPAASKVTQPTRLLAGRTVENTLIHAGLVEGHDYYVPRAVWQALQEVPRTLAKELDEFDRGASPWLTALDKFLRLWRVTAVYGYFLPRPVHFVNTYFGNWAQITTEVGWREGARHAIRSASGFIPFVGHRLQKAVAATNTALPGLFDQEVAKVLTGSDDVIVATKEGPITARKFMLEAIEDGTREGMGSQDLREIARRTNRRWTPLDSPAHIEATARFMEAVESKNRLRLYLHARTSGLSREEARQRLADTLYDWTTGIPEWEKDYIGRLAAFWAYRRLMLRQLGASLTEAFTEPTYHYLPKALMGQTKIARMRQLGLLASSVPDALYWRDPEEYMDDDEQLHALGKQIAPWWGEYKWWLGNWETDPARQQWYKTMTGRKVTFDAYLLPSLTTLDQLASLDLLAQNMAVTAVYAAETAGMRPTVTTADAQEIAKRNINAFADQMMPILKDAIQGALEELSGQDVENINPQGVPLSQAQAVMLRRLGWDDFMAAEPDANGVIRMDKTAYGIATGLVLGTPWANDLARSWRIFDNPSMQQSFDQGMWEAGVNLLGFVRQSSFDPLRQVGEEAKADASRLKSEIKAAEREVNPRP